MMASWLNMRVATAVRNYADSVVHHAGQAFVGGAKMIQDRMGTRKSFKLVARRLEEEALTCKGEDRVQLLKQWLADLREVAKLNGESVEESISNEPRSPHESSMSPENSRIDLSLDQDDGVEPINFHGVFLYSQALEGIIVSMIMEAPNEEEVSLLSELFGLCLTGDEDSHKAVVSKIQDLADKFGNYEDEVLAKHKELLQFAQSAISGIKINADLQRIDLECSTLRKEVAGIKALQLPTGDRNATFKNSGFDTEDGLKEALAEVRCFARMEALMYKKKSINPGDPYKTHYQKIDKLKVLAESLANSSHKAENRILENRQQKEEALSFRIVKSTEVAAAETELIAEITVLEKQRDELEAQLHDVKVSLSTVVGRLKKTREERDQFDEANNQILIHLKAKEDEMSRFILSSTAEAETINAWTDFLQHSWELQSSNAELRARQTTAELMQCEDDYVRLMTHHLSACKEVIGGLVERTRTYVDNLKIFVNSDENAIPAGSNPRKYLEEEYVSTKNKLIAAFAVVHDMKDLYFQQPGGKSRKEDSGVNELFAALAKLRTEFDALEIPVLERAPDSPLSKLLSPILSRKISTPKSAPRLAPQFLYADSEFAYSESGSRHSQGHSQDEITGWEFDEELASNHNTHLYS